MIAIFAFAISLMIPTFGGPIGARFTAMDFDSCIKLQKTILRELVGMRVKFVVMEECKPVLIPFDTPAEKPQAWHQTEPDHP